MNKLLILIRNPQMVVSLVWNYFALKTRVHRNWASSASDTLLKEYGSYSEYLIHQKSKLRTIQNTWLVQYDEKYRRILRARLKKIGLSPGLSVLCLAARIGTEVKAFRDLQAFAIGVDINPGRSNEFVLYGDFHRLNFPDSSVDVIFTNSLDHVFNIENFLKEIKRLLKPNGRLILEIGLGTSEGGKPGYYESFQWQRISDIVAIFKKHGFLLKYSKDFKYPWRGKQLLFLKKKALS